MSEAASTTFHLYGRTSYEEPLRFVTTVAAASATQIEPPDGQTWLELVAFPETAIIQVIPYPETQAEATP